MFKSYSESRVVIDDDLIVPLGPGKIRDESTSMNTANAIAAGVDSAAVSSSLDEQALKAARKLEQPLFCHRVMMFPQIFSKALH